LIGFSILPEGDIPLFLFTHRIHKPCLEHVGKQEEAIAMLKAVLEFVRE